MAAESGETAGLWRQSRGGGGAKGVCQPDTGLSLSGLCAACVWKDVSTGERACAPWDSGYLGQIADLASNSGLGMCLVLDKFCRLIDFILALEESERKIS